MKTIRSLLVIAALGAAFAMPGPVHAQAAASPPTIQNVQAFNLHDSAGDVHGVSLADVAQMDRNQAALAQGWLYETRPGVDSEGKKALERLDSALDARLAELDRETAANNTDLLLGRPLRYKPQAFEEFSVSALKPAIYSSDSRKPGFHWRT